MLDVCMLVEFGEVYIMGVYNLLFFLNEEWVEVGIFYKQVSFKKVFLCGLEFVGFKMWELVE